MEIIISIAVIVGIVAFVDVWDKAGKDIEDRNKQKLLEQQQKLEAKLQHDRDHPYYPLIKWFLISVVTLMLLGLIVLISK